jgi:hypothetical protein
MVAMNARIQAQGIDFRKETIEKIIAEAFILPVIECSGVQQVL